MKTNTFSIVVGDARCNMNCPYCVSKMTCTKAPPAGEPINWNRFHTACKVVEKAANGLISVLMTGKGEPLLFPEQISQYLSAMNGRFPLVDLQTNGVEIMNLPDSQLHVWRNMGLTLVCISVAHSDPRISNNIMEGPDGYNFWHAVNKVRDAGLACRINCTMVHGGVENEATVDRLITACAVHKVEQLTIRAVAKPNISKSPKVAKWIAHNQPEWGNYDLYSYMVNDLGATELLRLPHGACVFDYKGNNVCVGNCLTLTDNPEDIRQIIFFPDGRISYDWQYPGARIL